MSKIDDFEDKMILDGMSDEEFEEYKLMLRRVHDNWNKYQRCIISAIKFAPEYYTRAILLIEYAIKEFGDEFFLSRNPYEAMGDIYFKAKQYGKSYDSYLSALKIYSENHRSYISNISGKLLWAKLHLDNFQYSEEAEEHYREFIKGNDWDQAFLNSKLRRYVAELVISLHYKDEENIKVSYENIRIVLSPDYKGGMYKILRCNNYTENPEITDELSSFLKKCKVNISNHR